MKHQKLFLTISLLAFFNLQSLPGQSAGEYRTQLLRYFEDERINQALFLAAAALREFPDDPLFQLAGGNPEPNRIFSIHPTPEQAKKGKEQISDFADILIGMENLYAEVGIRLYRYLAEANPEDPLITFRLARHLFRSGEIADPAETLAIITWPGPVGGGAVSGTEHERFRDAVKMLADGAAPQPKDFANSFPKLAEDHALLRGLAANAMEERDCRKALDYLEKTLLIEPWDEKSFRLQSSAYDCLGMQAAAGTSAEQAERIARHRASLRSLDGLIRSGSTSEAAKALEIILSEAPGFREAARALARIYVLDGKRIEASEVYRSYLAVFPDDLKIRDLAAGFLIDAGLYDRAALLTSGWEESSAGRLAGAYQMINGGNWSGAEQVLRQILPRNPLDPMILVQLSRCLVSLNRFDEARAFLEKGRQGNPGSEIFAEAFQEVEFEYARYLSENGRRQEAVAAYRDLVKMDPKNPDYLLNLGYEEMMNGEYTQSVIHFKKGLAIDPGQDWARSGLAYSLVNEWEFDEAVEQMKILISRSDDPDYLLQLGSIYNQIGNTREGWALIRKAARQGQPEAARLVKERYGEN